ncbi:MAG: GDP-mannose 4,6-dehydratase, partial [Flavobacteriales bacterium]|nr:GDP-mannose 4,6-dehydratase [Flavobacteriales bacterium]
MNTALITGISGQDGAYLAKLLLERGYDVLGTSRTLDSINLYRLSFLGIRDRVKVLECSFTSQEDVTRLIEEVAPDEVYNLAAQSSVGYSFENPIGAFESNILGVTYLLNAVRKTKKKIRFYHASSSEMFGNINELPVREDSYFRPSSPYGISKAASHWLTINYREGYDMFAVCGILFNHESCLRGQNYVTKKIIEGAIKIANGEMDKLKLGNLNVTRDWGYAPKYVEAMWMMLQQGEPRDYLVCTNSHISLKDFVVLVFEQVNLNFDDHVEIDTSL